jgi:TetR/AcrR family transcriptional regulator
VSAERIPSFDVSFPAILSADRDRAVETQPTRVALLKAASAAFAKSGFEGVTVRDIERLAGVNRGLVAHHFGGKDGLWEATLDAMMIDMSDDLHRYWEFLGLVSTPERGRILLRVYVQFVSGHPEFFRLLLIEGREQSKRLEMLIDRCMRPLEQMFREATGASEDDPAEDQAIQHFTLFGAASVVFAARAHAGYLFGVDPSDPGFVERFADAIGDIWTAVDLEPRIPTDASTAGA